MKAMFQLLSLLTDMIFVKSFTPVQNLEIYPKNCVICNIFDPEYLIYIHEIKLYLNLQLREAINLKKKGICE